MVADTCLRFFRIYVVNLFASIRCLTRLSFLLRPFQLKKHCHWNIKEMYLHRNSTVSLRNIETGNLGI